MRDFRDAKAMAHALREALKAKAVATTHSESLELIAKAFGYEHWNILAAKVEAARSEAPDAAGLSTGATVASEARRTLHCSFCGKSQHEVGRLIAGPAVFICDACVGLCNGIIESAKVWDGLAADEERVALADARAKPAEELVSEVLRAKKQVEYWRLTLAQIKRERSMRDGEVPAGDGVPALPGFDYLRNKTREELLALEQRHERALKRYEEAQRAAAAVFGERGQ